MLIYYQHMTIGEHLLQVADAGLVLSKMNVNEDIFTHLNVLLAIEDALDQGRVSLMLLDSGTEYGTVINTKMDELRGKIALLISQCDKFEFQKFMVGRADRLKNQFNI